MEWLPVIQMLPLIAAAKPGRDRTLEAVRLLELVATKTQPKMDDEIIALIKAVVMTEQGGKLVDYIADHLKGAFNEPA
jgi:hypothetical protein